MIQSKINIIYFLIYLKTQVGQSLLGASLAEKVPSTGEQRQADLAFHQVNKGLIKILEYSKLWKLAQFWIFKRLFPLKTKAEKALPWGLHQELIHQLKFIYCQWINNKRNWMICSRGMSRRRLEMIKRF